MSVFAGAVALIAFYVAVVAALLLAGRRAERREAQRLLDERRRRAAATPAPDNEAALYCQACGCRYTHPDPWAAIGDACRRCPAGTLALNAHSVDLLSERTVLECEAWLKARTR